MLGAISSDLSAASETIQAPPGQLLSQATVPTRGQGVQISDIAAGKGSTQGPTFTGASSHSQTTGQISEHETHVMKPDYDYFKLAGAVLEKSIYTLKNFSKLIPVPALGPAMDAICACVEHFHVR